MNDFRMIAGAHKLLSICTRTTRGEQVVIVTDPASLLIAESLSAAAFQIGAEPSIIVMTPRTTDSTEPPEPIAEAMKAADVFFTPVSRSITHTHAVRNAVQAGARGLVMTQWTPSMLVTGGIEADFEAVAPLCTDIATHLERGTTLSLSTPAGTELTADIRGRRGNSLTGIVGSGEFSTIPTIEANVSPCEGTAKGDIVADASIPYLGIGVLNEPVTLDVEDGFILNIKGGREATILRDNLRSMDDPNVYNIAEVGIGLNPNARLQGNMLEDEGVFGVVHIGIGTNITLGGTLKASCHYDLLMWGANLSVDSEPILINGMVTQALLEKHGLKV